MYFEKPDTMDIVNLGPEAPEVTNSLLVSGLRKISAA